MTFATKVSYFNILLQNVTNFDVGNGERGRKWRENEEMEHSLYFVPLYPFPISKIVIFCHKMLNTELLSGMSQKT